MPRAFLALALILALSACSGASEPSEDIEAPTAREEITTEATPTPPTDSVDQADEAGDPGPDVPTGPLDPDTRADLDSIFDDLSAPVNVDALARIGESGDPRIAWLVGDLLRFISGGAAVPVLTDVFEELTGTELALTGGQAFTEMTNRLIRWDMPAIPGYSDYKGRLFTFVEPGWTPFFADPADEIDWRLVTWGGVFIDDRELGNTGNCPRGCIPALDDPAVTDAAGGDWYPDSATVFGLEVGGETRAYPKNIMEVHEMVNDTLGGRRIGMPYCTLCGSAQTYFTDTVQGNDLILRTSGLLSRSNKVMYDLVTKSVFDTFTGRAVSGALREQDVQLKEVTVVTAPWGEWKDAHPDTTIIAQDGGIGRVYPADPLGGRDDDGPIFPIGDADPRLPVHESVVGALTPEGRAVAFPAGQARLTLESGGDVELAGVRLRSEGGGLVAESIAGEELTSHQSFWFAWSQFYPETGLWQATEG